MRILHIGNIANNAWQNAKLMDEQEGAENFVLCYDYYHSMGTPEWEEADFDAAEIDDHFFPRWAAVDLHGFERPKSFVQGPRRLCLEYLESVGGEPASRASGDRVGREIQRLWRRLELASGLGVAKSFGEKVSSMTYSGRRKLLGVLVGLAAALRSVLAGVRFLVRWATGRTGEEVGAASPRGTSLSWKVRMGVYSFLAKVVDLVYGIRESLVAPWSGVGRANRHGVGKIGGGEAPGHGKDSEGDPMTVWESRVHRVGSSRDRVKRWIERRLGLEIRDEQEAWFRCLVAEFRARFPDRSDALSVEDCRMWASLGDEFGPVLRRWDIVQAYSTDPILPMVAGQPYFAFEHGTLRDIPFEESPRGRMTALAYAKAEHVFVTNFDCLEKAHQLTGDPERVTFINHPFDENDLPARDEVDSLRWDLLRDLDCEHLIFFPTRHDWVEGKGYADKANDHLLRAVADLRRTHELDVGLVLCEWGNNFRESRQLVRELGYAAHTRWLAPQATRRFMKMCMACDVVADQFKLGSFGGVLFKAMATGTPICTYLDVDSLLRIHPEVPPVINARTREEIGEGLGAMLPEPGELTAIGEGGRRWIEKHHSGAETVRKQFARYRDFLAGDVAFEPAPRERLAPKPL